MGSMLRSDLMSLCDMYLQPESAFEILAQLGELGCVQFIDMTPDVNAFQRNYVSEVRRCTELERKLRYMKGEMIKDDIYVPKLQSNPEALHPNELTVYENTLEKWENDILEMEANQVKLTKNHMDLLEMYYVLTHIEPILGDVELRRDSLFLRAGGDIGFSGRLVVKTGVVRRIKSFPFEMMLWRVSRGNIYFRTAAQDKIFEDPFTCTEVRKVAFLAVCQGEQLNSRLEKVCNGFRVNVYPCPRTYEERKEMISKLELRLKDLEQVLKKTKYHRCKALRTVGRQWLIWALKVKKARATYHTMNLFNLDITRKCLIGQCWVPDQDLTKVREILDKCSVAVGSTVSSFMSTVKTSEVPPTYHRTNKFTHGFQALICAYGDSTYRELNPGLYTIITFPFLFAIMFGDLGHGIIMLSAATWMLVNEKKFMAQKSDNEIWAIFFGGRYIILLMSLFTLYTGFIYNDIFSKPMFLTHSYWKSNYTIEVIEQNEQLTLDPAGDSNNPYIFGVDPMWGNVVYVLKNIDPKAKSVQIGTTLYFGKTWPILDNAVVQLPRYTLRQLSAALARKIIPKLRNERTTKIIVISVRNNAYNKIMFDNSIKMKLSIILGVIHMLFGLSISLFNHIHFKRYYAVILEFIPQVLFLSCLFLWLVFLMYFKWFTYSAKESELYLKPGCAPLILILFIDMALIRSTTVEDTNCNAYMFDTQQLIQKILMGIALGSVPIMLFGPPLYKNRLNKKSRIESAKWSKTENFKEHDETTFSELMIHQSVHTIEFVLSTISHTASYLRLWALSLAHAQLSEMLWVMILSKIGLHNHTSIGFLYLFVIFAIWASFSLSILVVMEGLSAFLHTLRLHWVEFMSKFYAGGGCIFAPFNFVDVLHLDGKDEK